MLDYNDLKKGVMFLYEGHPYEVIEANFLRMQQRKAVVNTKIRNLETGKILDRTWQASDSFEEVEVERKKAIFIYQAKGEYWFHEEGDKAKRFALPEDVVGDPGKFLIPNTPVMTMVFRDKVITVEVPVKMTLLVKEAPPAIKGNTAQGGTKMVVLENGSSVTAPLFINEGDRIIVNTTTGLYVERA